MSCCTAETSVPLSPGAEEAAAEADAAATAADAAATAAEEECDFESCGVATGASFSLFGSGGRSSEEEGVSPTIVTIAVPPGGSEGWGPGRRGERERER